MGGFSAGKSGNRGRARGEGAGGGLPPPARDPGAGPPGKFFRLQMHFLEF